MKFPVPLTPRPLALLISTLALAACGGGGGGGGGGGSASPVRATEEQPTASSSRPALVISMDELARSPYVTQSGAKKAWEQGYGGKGVTVALLDSGLAAGLPEFDGRVHGASGNFTEDADGKVIKQQPVTDDFGHGTWVASILGAAANNQLAVGVAPEATLLALGFYGQADVTADNGLWINTDRLNRALQESRTAGAAIVNGSFTLDGDLPAVRAALQQSVAAGQLLTFAAGNDGTANPGLPARYAKETWANGQIIAVGAVDSHNAITDYSNRAGDAMDFFLVARGDVQATGKDGKLAAVAGTSFAAPQVAGAAALLKEKWPRLTAPQVAKVLFTSATDLGAAGTDPVYGRGLLNIDRAMQPIGQPTIATAAGTAVPVAATGLALPAGGVAAALAVAAARGAFTVAAVDSFGRDFRTNLAPRISRADSPAAADLQQGLARDLFGVERHFGSLRLSLLPAAPAAGSQPAGILGSFFGYGEGSRWQFAGGSTDRLGQFFGLADRFPGQAHPYFQFARDGQFAGSGFALSDHARLRAGALAAAAATGQVVDVAYSSRSRLDPRPQAGDWSLALTAGTLAEKDRLLGMAGSGALAVAPGRSRFATLAAGYRLDPRTEAGASLTLGRTEGSSTGLLAFSPVAAWSAEASLAHSDAWRPGDRLSFTVGKPMVIRSGTLAMTLPARVADDGRLGFRETSLALGGGPTETRFGVAYGAPGSKAGRFGVSGLYRLNADNEPGRREGLLGFQYHLRFD